MLEGRHAGELPLLCAFRGWVGISLWTWAQGCPCSLPHSWVLVPELLPFFRGGTASAQGSWGALAVLEGSWLVQGLRREQGVCVASGFLMRV